jgi:hypothetical protein
MSTPRRSSLVIEIRLFGASIASTIPRLPATQIRPSPAATSIGPPGTGIVRRIVLVVGSTLQTRSSSVSATHTRPAPNECFESLVAYQGPCVALTPQFLQEAGRSLDIHEEKRDGSTWEIRHGSTSVPGHARLLSPVGIGLLRSSA